MSGGAAPKQKEWRKLDWLSGYEISEDGEMRNTASARVIRGALHPRGYRQFSGMGPHRRTLKAHRLVCEAWHGPHPSDKPYVAPNDGNPANNHYTNLRWASAKENQDDRLRHGTHNRGERCANATLTWEMVRKIRVRLNGTRGELTKLSQEYGVSIASISRIRSGESWSE